MRCWMNAASWPSLGQAQPCNASSMDARDVAQAVELVRALHGQLNEMTHQLVRLERQGVTGTNSQASAIRSEAAALRVDISRAQVLIDRLQRRYLNSPTRRTPSPVDKALRTRM
jgi:hypothetical protein